MFFNNRVDYWHYMWYIRDIEEKMNKPPIGDRQGCTLKQKILGYHEGAKLVEVMGETTRT